MPYGTQPETEISIHALREEGDDPKRVKEERQMNFYPRPPRGGRRLALSPSFLFAQHFYPRPPRGGRPQARCSGALGGAFLSTPSARRATAPFRALPLLLNISIHALREEGDSFPDFGNS